MKHYIAIVLIVYMAALAGCSNQSDLPALADVKGRVIQAGKPVAGAEVRFRPVSEKAGLSYAVTDENGEFVLKYSSDANGAVVGNNEIMITVFGKRAPSEVPGQLGPPLTPPVDFVLGQKEIPEEGLESIELEVPEMKQRRMKRS